MKPAQMKKILIALQIICCMIVGALSLAACKDDWFDVESSSIMTEQQIYASNDGVTSILANMYSRLNDGQAFNTGSMNEWDESISNATNQQTTDYGDAYRRYYDYGLIREINLFLKNLDLYGEKLNPDNKEAFKAEARFLRAYTYFEMVKSMGGIPLITEASDYDEAVDFTTYQTPRSKEIDVYEFIHKELDDIKEKLDLRDGNNNPVKNRASKGAALALKCRAMLYAGSIAKYNASRNDLSLTLPGGETGIPADKANYFYGLAVDAAKELIEMGVYSLYTKNVSSKSDNFAELFLKKNAENPEAIFVKDFDGKSLTNFYTQDAIPRSLRSLAGSGSRVGPTLNLIEQFERMDGTISSLKTVNGTETVEEVTSTRSTLDYIVYDNALDIFASRDPRLMASILTPGSKFRGADLQLWAGIAVWNNNGYDFKHTLSIDNIEQYNNQQMTGVDGPHATSEVTNTGFLIRKYLDPNPGSESQGKSDVAFIRFRYAEVLLNAAEAAYEMGDPEGLALGYLNQIRTRAGLPILSAITTIESIRHEREVELAFEDHRFNDVRRWRTGDKIFDGNRNTKTALICGLWPYRISRPGHPTDGRWLFRRVRANKRNNPVKFINSNYYTGFEASVLSRNPLLVKNPYQY